jgi:peptide deformylase
MAILKVARLGHPILRTQAEPIRNVQALEIQRLIDDMIETMREYAGIGLAATQVHRSLQLCVIEGAEGLRTEHGEEWPRTPLVLINPRLTPLTERMVEDWEGCLSLPDLRGKVPRHTAIEVEALDRQGKSRQFKATDFLARVIQHEADHLDATVFIDRMKSLETLSFLAEYARYWAPEGAPIEEDG